MDYISTLLLQVVSVCNYVQLGNSQSIFFSSFTNVPTGFNFQRMFHFPYSIMLIRVQMV